MSDPLANFFSSVSILQAILSWKRQRIDKLCFALLGKEVTNFICFWGGDPLLLFLHPPLWPWGKRATFGFGRSDVQGQQISSSRIPCSLDWEPRISFSGVHGSFSGALFAAAGFPLVVFLQLRLCPSCVPTIPRLDGACHLSLFFSSV